MQQDIYMTTGEFARMMRVSKDTLFHYDKIGLLKPEIVKTNGYRYYTRQICWRPSSCCGIWGCR